MKKYVTYFDLLGFKSFILNNDTEHIKQRIGHILRDIESAIGQGEKTITTYGYIANISKSKINCLNISDTIIFWTNDDTLESFEEILKISFDFNWMLTCYDFPVKGAIVYDEIDIISGFQKTEKGGTYNVNSIYGKGLVNAHLKAENLNLASCVIDKSVLAKISQFGKVENLIGDYAMLHQVPYKNGKENNPEYLLKFYINKTINKEACKNRALGIEAAFKSDNKGMNERSEILLKNTLDFLALLVD